MKRITTLAGVLTIIPLLLAGTVLAQGPTNEEIQASIDAGVTWLVQQQNLDGSWGTWEQVGKTGLALVKLEERAFDLGKSPFDPDYEFHGNVIDGLDYLFNQAAHCPGPAICFARGSWHETYNTGIAMMAVAAGRAPARVVSVGNPVVDGLTYREVVQRNVDFFAGSQNPDGGWRYWASNQPSDNSNTGYAVLGLYYADEFGAVIPPSLKTNLSGYVDYIQNDVDGDPNDGGSGYTNSFNWVNQLKTGNLLFEMALVGDDASSSRAQAALDYIGRHWDDPNPDPGWRPHHFQAMYCLMKGFQTLGVESVTVVRGVPVDVDWYGEFAEAILANQRSDGSWQPDYWGDDILSTAWALLTLERIPPASIYVDVKPGSDPNSINCLIDAPVIPVAILGSAGFDATRVDHTTVRFGRIGIEAQEIHASRKTGELIRHEKDANDDGYFDLVFHFSFEDTGLGCMDTEAWLTGATYGGQPLRGNDAVRMVPEGPGKRVAGSEAAPATFDLLANYPNPFNPTTTISFALPQAADVILTVFDVLGRQVRVLASGRHAEGRYEVTFDASGLPSGVFLYRLEAGDYVQTRRMVLSK